MSRVEASVDFLTRDAIAGVAYGLGLREYSRETEESLLCFFGEESVKEARDSVARGRADDGIREIAFLNPLDAAERMLRREEGL